MVQKILASAYRFAHLLPATVGALTVSFSLHAKEIRENPIEKKLSRYEPFKIDDIEASSAQLNFNHRQVAEDLSRKLDEFYLSDPSEKKIANRQDNDSNSAWYRKEWNVNLQRLFMRDLLAKTQKGFIIKEAPNIALLHYNYALAQQKLNKPYHAAYHFLQSLRYRSVKFDPEIYVDQDRLKLSKTGSAEITDAQQYAKLRADIDAKRREKIKIEEEIIIADDRLRSPAINPPSSGGNVEAQKESSRIRIEEQKKISQEKLKSVKDEYERLTADFAKAQTQYAAYEKTYNQRSADQLVEMANLVRQLENLIKERSKVQNKKTLYKTSFNQTLQHDYSENRQFTAYANILEAATRLDAENPQNSFKLAEEYRTSQEPNRAIDAYEKALAIQSKSRANFELQSDQIQKAKASLGALYYERGRFVDSVYYYEAALKETTKASEKSNLSWQLAKIHVEKTGNYDRAITLFTEHLESLKPLNPTETGDRVQWIKERFNANRYLLQMYQKKNDPAKMLQAMSAAKAAHQDIEELIVALRQRNHNTYSELQEAKKKLANEVRSADLNIYLNIENDYEKQKRELSLIETVRNSLPLPQFYFQYAEVLESAHNIDEALDVLGYAEKQGISASQARREMDRIRRKYKIPQS